MWQPYRNGHNWIVLNNHDENFFRLRYVSETLHDVLLQTSWANNWNSLTYMEQLVWELSQCWWSSCKFSSTCYLNFISVFTIKRIWTCFKHKPSHSSATTALAVTNKHGSFNRLHSVSFKVRSLPFVVGHHKHGSDHKILSDNNFTELYRNDYWRHC
jgi:hypothetical protein